MAKLDTHYAPGRKAKDWSWSYSKLKNYRTCPKRHYEVDLAKNYGDGGGEALVWGNQVHEALATTLKDGTPLPVSMASYEYWVDRVRRGPGELFIEQKYAINRNFEPTAYFAPDAWYRGIGDVVRIDDIVALVLDWKTGKPIEDRDQLILMAHASSRTSPRC